MMRRGLFISVLAGLALTSAGQAQTYDKDACKALGEEHAGLTAAGLKADMEKGADWGKANLGEDRLKLIARLIEVEEALAFRCRTLNIPIKRRELLPKIDELAGDDFDLPAAAASAPVKPAAKKPEQGSAADARPAAQPSTGVKKPNVIAVPKPKTGAPATTGSTEASAAQATEGVQKPAVVRLKPKTVAKKKPAPAPKPEPPGLFDLGLE